MKYYADKFAKLKLKKVYHYLIQYGGTEPFICGKDEVVEAVTSLYDQPLIISRFENIESGRPVIMIVNNSQKTPTRVNVKLKHPYEKTESYEWLAPGQLQLLEL